MPSLIALLLCLSFVAPAGALAANALGPSHTLAEGSILHGRFVQERRLEGFKQPLRSEGRFMLAPGRGLIWQSEKPFALTTVITSAGLVQEVGGSEPMRMPTSRLPFLAKLYDMLGGAMAGNWQALEREFTVVRQGDDTAWRVELQPKTAADPTAMPIQTIRIAGRRFVERVEIIKKGGDADVLNFAGQTLSDTPPSEAEAALLAGVGR